MHKRRALFLDRDGVINEDTGYPHRPEQIVFREGIFPLCRTAVERGFLIVVVTNQAGVAKGRFSEHDVVALHEWMGERFCEHGVAVAAFYYCPYHKDGSVEKYRRDSDMRKPNPGMILQAARDLDIDIFSSIMVGDKPSDRIRLDSLRSIIIQSPYTGDDYDVKSLDEVSAILQSL